ncbi:kinesin heavy chain isoform X5 [Hydra vulgaris]|uniref:Kinesin heavy chain isoform X5 n=1 Tax=Hydra vulgaris TaxID=6087 RepID=A0ABM4BLW9_HYDVU
METKDLDFKKDHIKVFVRLKSSSWNENQIYNVTDRKLQIIQPNEKNSKKYKFDKILPIDSCNKEVYDSIGRPLLDGVIMGYNAALFAYGQTGSGKTYTLMSKDGFIAHMVCGLFNKIKSDTYNQYKVTFSYFQLYKERFYDLLNPEQKTHSIRENPQEGTYVENVSRIKCESPSEVYTLLNSGHKQLAFAAKKKKRQPNRSHVLCQFFIERKKKNEYPEFPIESSSPRFSFEDEADSHLNVEHIPHKNPNLKKRHSIAVSQPTKGPRGTNKSLRPKSDLTFLQNDINLNTFYDPHKARFSLYDNHKLESSSLKRHSLQISGKKLNRSFSSVQNSSQNDVRKMKELANGIMNENVLNIRRSSRIDSSDLTEIESLMLSQESLSSMQSADSVLDDLEWESKSSISDLSKISFQFGSSEIIKEQKENCCNEFKNKKKNVDEDNYFKTKLTIVDLAGSDSLKESEDEKSAETQNINLSLLQLGNVIAALAEDQRTHIPYRNSVLTRLLQDSLGGNCKTSFVLCISTASDDIIETRRTLEFGKRLLKVKLHPQTNTEVEYKMLCHELQEENFKLEEAFNKEKEKMSQHINELLNNKVENVQSDLNIPEIRVEEIKNEYDHKYQKVKEKLKKIKLENIELKNQILESKLNNSNNLQSVIVEGINKSFVQNANINEPYFFKLPLLNEIGTSTEQVETRTTSTEPITLCHTSTDPIFLQDSITNLAVTRDDSTDAKIMCEASCNTKKVVIFSYYTTADVGTSPSKHLKTAVTCNASTDATRVMCNASCNTNDVVVRSTYTTSDIATSPIKHLEVDNNASQTVLSKMSSSNTNSLDGVTSNSRLISEDDVLCRLTNFLLAELISMQLLFSMSDIRLQNGRTQSCSARIRIEHRLKYSKITSSVDENDLLEKNEMNESINENISNINDELYSTSFLKYLKNSKRLSFFKSPDFSNTESQPKFEKRTSQVESILEGITESTWLHDLDNLKNTSFDRLKEISNEILLQKRNVDLEITKFVEEVFHDSKFSTKEGRVSKREVYSELVNKLTQDTVSSCCTIEQLEQILNLVLVDHSLTGCLLALAQHKQNRKMRRLSSFKSTPKPLLDSIVVDECCGYENVFDSLDDDESYGNDIDINTVEVGQSSPSCSPNNSPHTVEKVHKKNSRCDNSFSKEETCTDLVAESPSQKKKGIRRFFCMPSKSTRWSMHNKKFLKKNRIENNLLLDGNDIN